MLEMRSWLFTREFCVGFVLPRSTFFPFQSPPVIPPSQRPKKSGHSIRDILGHTDDDYKTIPEEKPTDLSLRGASESRREEKMSTNPTAATTETTPESSSPTEMTSSKQDPDSEDEDVHVDVEDEEQLWD